MYSLEPALAKQIAAYTLETEGHPSDEFKENMKSKPAMKIAFLTEVEGLLRGEGFQYRFAVKSCLTLLIDDYEKSAAEVAKEILK